MTAGEFLLYQTEDGHTRVECRFADETLWLSQAGMAALFQTSKQNAAKHLKAIFAEGELDGDSVVNQWLTTATDGKAYRVAHLPETTQFFLNDSQTKLDEFLRFNDRGVLPDAGHVSKKSADVHALAQYERFAEERRSERESQGESDAIRALEQASRQLDGPKAKRKPRD